MQTCGCVLTGALSTPGVFHCGFEGSGSMCVLIGAKNTCQLLAIHEPSERLQIENMLEESLGWGLK